MQTNTVFNDHYITAIILSVLGFVLVFVIRFSVNLIKGMHKQAMDKFDLLIDQVSVMSADIKVHDEKLITGAREFEKIATHQKEQDETISDHEKRIMSLELSK